MWFFLLTIFSFSNFHGQNKHKSRDIFIIHQYFICAKVPTDGPDMCHFVTILFQIFLFGFHVNGKLSVYVLGNFTLKEIP